MTTPDAPRRCSKNTNSEHKPADIIAFQLATQEANLKLALSESEIACDGESRFFCVKEGDEKCEPIQGLQFRKNLECQKRLGSARRYSSSSSVILTRLLRLLNHLTRYGEL
jgi:hypothetical protein